jgi:hypothetical protein
MLDPVEPFQNSYNNLLAPANYFSFEFPPSKTSAEPSKLSARRPSSTSIRPTPDDAASRLPRSDMQRPKGAKELPA